MALHHAAPGEIMALRSNEDHAVTTSALVKNDAFEAIHLVVRAGHQLKDHAVRGALTLYGLEGVVLIDLEDGKRRLSKGDWLYLQPNTRHAVRGVEDAGLLLTIHFDHATQT